MHGNRCIHFPGAATLVAACLALIGARARAEDCNANGVDDAIDLRDGTSADCDADGVPDECEPEEAQIDLGACEVISEASTPFALADLDGDSTLDLVLYRPGRRFLSVLRNDGRGDFAVIPPIVVPLHGRLDQLKVVDADRDGGDDLAILGRPDVRRRTLSLLRGGELPRRPAPAPRTLPFDFLPQDWVVGDLNADGEADLVVVHGFQAHVHLAESPGTFSDARRLLGVDPILAITADVNGDGRLDIVTANQSRNVSVFINRGAAEFGPANNYFADDRAQSMAGVDVDLDGDADLVVLNNPGGIAVLENSGAGAFPSLETHATIIREDGVVTAGDLDGDSFPDLLIGSPDTSFPTLQTLMNRGDGSFREAAGHYLFGFPSSVGVRDLNRDGKVEVLVAIEHGPIAFFRPRRAVADCNADGIPDACQLGENDRNGNGVPDDCESLRCSGYRRFVRGDSNQDGPVDSSDALAILVHLFVGGTTMPCESSADLDDNAKLDVSDPIYLLSWLFLGGDLPFLPFPRCGGDPTPDDLTCQVHAPCERG